MPPTWHIIPNPTLPSTPPATLAYVALHPARGIALIDVAPASTPNAVQCLRAGLERIGFERTFPGHLPIIHCQIEAFDRATLMLQLEAAFQAEAPITIGSDPESQKWPAHALRPLGFDAAAALPAFMPSPASPRLVRLDIRQSQEPPAPHGLSSVAAAGAFALLASGAGLWAYNTRPQPGAAPASHPVAATAAPAAVPPSHDPAPAPTEPPSPAAPIAPPTETTLSGPASAPSPTPAPPAFPQPQPANTASPSAAILHQRGDDLLSQHDIANARRFYEMAWRAGDGTAAVFLGQTYEASDPAKAREWYDKAQRTNDPRVGSLLKIARGVTAIAPGSR